MSVAGVHQPQARDQQPAPHGTLPGTFVGDGLRRGHRRLGLIASSDHGHGSSYVGAHAERLDRASIFEALAARRVFAATQRDLLVDFRIGDSRTWRSQLRRRQINGRPVVGA